METFELVLMIMVAVLLSAVLENVIPKVSTPLIQIFLGAIAAVLALSPISVTLNPEFFLPIFIAPLLFNDATHADRAALWKNRWTIISLAIGLVIALMLCVGFMMHLIVPTLPLAAAFALGAALGPTDAVAVSSLKASAKLKRDDAALLSGESLINDASGVVAFQFTVAAAVTGAFSLLDATATFAVQFFGGIVFGLFAGWLAHKISDFLIDEGLDSNAFHVTFNVLLPFIIYMTSEMIHVSGILAVVAAGILLSSFHTRNSGPTTAEMSVVASNVWDVLEFVLNGIVFVLLGMQLPGIFQGDMLSGQMRVRDLITISLVVTAILIAVRFVWIAVTAHLARDSETGQTRWERGGMRSLLVTTIGGAKGAVTLAVIMSLPMTVESGAAFPERDTLISIASIVILVTLLLANFLLPVLAPRPKPNKDQQERDAQANLLVLRNVLQRLPELAKMGNERALTTVSQMYNQRIARVREIASEDETSSVGLRIDVVNEQIDQMQGSIDGGKIDIADGMEFIHRLERSRDLLKQRKRELKASGDTVDESEERKARRFSRRPPLRVWIRSLLHRIGLRLTGNYSDVDEQTKLLELAQVYAVNYLTELQTNGSSKYPPEVVNDVLTQYTTALRRTRKTIEGGVESEFASVSSQINDLHNQALGIELEEIRQALDDGDITRRQARHMRENVYTMRTDLEENLS